MNPVFIVSAGRPRCTTARLLVRLGIEEFFIAVDEDDERVDDYRDAWGDKIICYRYKSMASDTDLMDNFSDPACGAAPARNGVWSIADKMGVDGFWMLDDDITAFTVPKPRSSGRETVKDGDSLISVMRMIQGYADATDLKCVGGACDMQGFPPSASKTNPYVRQMFYVKTNAPIRFRSRMEEDLAFSCDMLRNGMPPMALRLLGFRVKGVCEEPGGCSTIYERNGTVRRAAYNVLACPHASVRLDKFGCSGFPRWRLLLPKIVSGVFHREG